MADTICEDCALPIGGKCRRGRCENCYRRLIRSLKAAGEFVPVASKGEFLTQITPGWGGCWIYTGRVGRDGYPRVRVNGVRMRLHRLVYMELVGPIPPGLQIDHTCHGRDASCRGGTDCRHRRCINPAHLEPVSNRVNTLRGLSFAAANARKTHCPRGHEYTPENTRWRPAGGDRSGMYRECQTCRRTPP